jgi:hypothetical protein
VSFLADVIRFKRLRSRTKRRRLAKRIIELYLEPVPLPPVSSGSSHGTPSHSNALGHSANGRSRMSSGSAHSKHGSQSAAASATGKARAPSSPSISMEEADLCRRPSPADVTRRIGVFEAIPEPPEPGRATTPLLTSFGESDAGLGSPNRSIGSDKGSSAGMHVPMLEGDAGRGGVGFKYHVSSNTTSSNSSAYYCILDSV